MLLSDTTKSYDIEHAELGSTAIEMIDRSRDSPYRCVLLNAILRDTTAGQLLAKLSAGQSRLASPIIVLAGGEGSQDEGYLRAGASDFLATDSITPQSIALAVRNADERNDMTAERRMVEERLRATDAQLRFILDSMPQKIATTRVCGHAEYMNPQWGAFTGVPCEKLEGWGWTKFIHPNDVDAHVAAWRDALASGKPFEFESRIRRFDGEYRSHFSRALPMHDQNENIVMWIGSTTDIHDIRLAETAVRISELRYRRLFEAAKMGY